MPSSSLLGVFSALSAAIVWGAADFSGGISARKQNQFQVLVSTGISGMVVFVVAALIQQEGMLTPESIFWSALAGLFGAFGIAALYQGLSMGNTASIAPTAAVISTALPVVYSLITEGSPKTYQFLGFGIALLGIWLTSGSNSIKGDGQDKKNFLLAFVAGIGFSGFFILIAQVEPGKVFSPLLISRSMSLIVAFAMIRIQRTPMPTLFSNPPALIAGVLDAGGNILYMIAQQHTRLDVAVVLCSLCPAVTVVLAAIIMKEKVTRIHWVGVITCLLAAAMISV